jgi:hypothetical protein
MRLFRFFWKRPDKIHAGAETTTSLAHHMEHSSEKPFVFQSPPVEPQKIYAVPTYEEHLKGEVKEAQGDLRYSYGNLHDVLSIDLARENLDKAWQHLEDYQTELKLEMVSKTPFTKDDIKAKEGEFDNLKAMLKDNQLEADVARADFYGSSHSQEDVEYAENYDEMRCAEFCEKFTENEIDEAQDQITHMTRTLDNNHAKLNDAWSQSNDVNHSDHEPER